MKAADDGPLPGLLLALTVVSGLVDAVSFLRLGHVFVSNMTGNVVFLGFAMAGAGDIAPLRSIAALITFTLGSAIGGRLSIRAGRHRGRFLAYAIAAECVLVVATLALASWPLGLAGSLSIYAQMICLTLAMGLQNAAARTLAVADLTTTVVTLTMTAFASESFLGTGTNRNAGRRASAIAAMLLGAVIGGALVLHRGISQALVALLAILAGTGIAAYGVSRDAGANWAQAK